MPLQLLLVIVPAVFLAACLLAYCLPAWLELAELGCCR